MGSMTTPSSPPAVRAAATELGTAAWSLRTCTPSSTRRSADGDTTRSATGLETVAARQWSTRDVTRCPRILLSRFPVRSATRARASGATTTTNSWPIVIRSDARIHYAIMHHKYSERGNVYCGLLDV